MAIMVNILASYKLFSKVSVLGLSVQGVKYINEQHSWDEIWDVMFEKKKKYIFVKRVILLYITTKLLNNKIYILFVCKTLAAQKKTHQCKINQCDS